MGQRLLHGTKWRAKFRRKRKLDVPDTDTAHTSACTRELSADHWNIDAVRSNLLALPRQETKEGDQRRRMLEATYEDGYYTFDPDDS